MDILKPPPGPHLSTAQWSLSAGCALDPTHVVSPPTSIRNIPLGACWGVLLDPQFMHIKWGRITVWWWLDPGSMGSTKFRLQLGAPPWNSNECYQVSISTFDEAHLYEGKWPDMNLIGSWPWQPGGGAWYQIRVTWEPDCTDQAERALGVTFEVLVGPDPGNYGTLLCPNDYFADSPTNYVGFHTSWGPGAWMDNFFLELWTSRLD